MLSSRPKMQSLQIRFARTQVSRFCRVSTKKKQNASPFASVSQKSENTMARELASTMTTAMTKNSPTINPIQTMNNGITQDQANMMLMRLTALRGVLANGGNVHECQAALIAVTDELKHLLTPPEQMQETDKAEQSKSEDRSEERKAAARSRAVKERYLSGSALRILKRVPHIRRSIPRINSISRNILSTI